MEQQIDMASFANKLLAAPIKPPPPKPVFKLTGEIGDIRRQIQQVIEARRIELTDKLSNNELMADISEALEIPGGVPWEFELVNDGSKTGIGYAVLKFANERTAIIELWIEVE